MLTLEGKIRSLGRAFTTSAWEDCCGSSGRMSDNLYLATKRAFLSRSCAHTMGDVF